jgi:hypothetical protein
VKYNFFTNNIKTGPTTSKEWKTPDCRNTPSPTNLGEEGIVDDPGKDGNSSMPEQVKRPNPWKKKMMMMMMTNNIKIRLIYSALIHE